MVTLKTKGFIFSFSFSLIKRAKTEVCGYMNRTKDGLYAVFLDYDNFKLDWLKDELERLSIDYDIDHWFIFQSSRKSFHAVSFCKLTAREYVGLLNESGCDEAFKNVPRFTTYRSWVLRYNQKGIKDKPVFIDFISSDTLIDRECSNAHFIALRKLGLLSDEWIDFINADRWDNYTSLDLIKYKTGAKVLI